MINFLFIHLNPANCGSNKKQPDIRSGSAPCPALLYTRSCFDHEPSKLVKMLVFASSNILLTPLLFCKKQCS